MISISERAKRELQSARIASQIVPAQALRLAPDGDGSLLLFPDTANRQDIVVCHDETPLLILDRSVAGQLTESLLDYAPVEADGGNMRFVLLRETDSTDGTAAANSQSDSAIQD